MIRIAPSLLASDFANLQKEIESVSHADFLHVDIMDGVFVPNLAMGVSTAAAIGKVTKIPMDVHLMIIRPQNYIEAFAKAGAEIITVHTESDCDLGECIAKIKACGKKPGLVINPDTPIDAVLPYLEELYMVLVMTVQPGFGGQKCREDCFEKVRALRKIITERGLSVHIEVDGGITAENAPKAIAAGADVLVAGSSVFGAPDRNAAIDALRGI
ncbi:MAG: ribulose-phosphate 3-epimerase [Clostridia bacterium]|nr:ribulose-phosphate 3-epimerase [Clostridia bacterium]MBQ2272273.1 ribulose-phosphate 3-epimerase [Clostridia bacterium]